MPTTWLDYKANPAENNGPPPVGAPENMPTSQVNNVSREIMSVIRLMGDEFQADLDGLGTMATQDATAVAITGGTITATLNGPGAGITNLKSQNLIEGPIPAAIFPPDATPLNAKVARAGTADSLTSTLSILPIGTILMWYSANPVPAGWHVCDGTAGTPNLMARFPIGAGAGVGLGQQGGQYSYSAVTDLQGAHDHGPTTGNTVLTEAQMPSHVHTEFLLSGSGGPYAGPIPIFDGTTGHAANIQTLGAGGNQPHNHSIAVTGNHQHNVSMTVTPPYTAVWFIMRIS
jgi:hypothetical protein